MTVYIHRLRFPKYYLIYLCITTVIIGKLLIDVGVIKTNVYTLILFSLICSTGCTDWSC